MAAKKKAIKAAPTGASPAKTVNKAEWVRSQPATMPAAEVVKKAKGEGIVLSTAYVYVIRGKAKSGGGKKARKAGRPVGSVVRAASTAPSKNSLESEFIRLALLLGLERSANIIGRVRQLIDG